MVTMLKKQKIIITCGPTSGSVSGRPLRKLPLPPMQGGLDTKKTPPTGGLAVKRTQQKIYVDPILRMGARSFLAAKAGASARPARGPAVSP